jgi:hypothetical protein
MVSLIISLLQTFDVVGTLGHTRGYVVIGSKQNLTFLLMIPQPVSVRQTNSRIIRPELIESVEY